MLLLWDASHLVLLALMTVIKVLLAVSEVIEEKMPRRAADALSDAGPAQSRQNTEV